MAIMRNGWIDYCGYINTQLSQTNFQSNYYKYYNTVMCIFIAKPIRM